MLELKLDRSISVKVPDPVWRKFMELPETAKAEFRRKVRIEAIRTIQYHEPIDEDKWGMKNVEDGE